MNHYRFFVAYPATYVLVEDRPRDPNIPDHAHIAKVSLDAVPEELREAWETKAKHGRLQDDALSAAEWQAVWTKYAVPILSKLRDSGALK